MLIVLPILLLHTDDCKREIWFVFSGFGGRHSHRPVIGGIVSFQQGFRNVDISIGVVSREIVPHSRFQSPVNLSTTTALPSL